MEKDVIINQRIIKKALQEQELKFYKVGSKKRYCLKCKQPRNHAGKSSNVFYCNNCKKVMPKD